MTRYCTFPLYFHDTFIAYLNPMALHLGHGMDTVLLHSSSPFPFIKLRVRCQSRKARITNVGLKEEKEENEKRDQTLLSSLPFRPSFPATTQGFIDTNRPNKRIHTDIVKNISMISHRQEEKKGRCRSGHFAAAIVLDQKPPFLPFIHSFIHPFQLLQSLPIHSSNPIQSILQVPPLPYVFTRSARTSS